MKTKTFLLFSTSVFATTIFLIVFHSQQPQSIQNIVTQTHQHIKDFQDNLRDVEEKNMVQDGKYFHELGLNGETEMWHNTTVPVLVTYAHGDGHASVVGFIRSVSKLPYTVLLYNLGLNQHSLTVVSNYCNSSKCVILDFDLSVYPSHVGDMSIHAFRPLIIQHALSRTGGVVFAEPLSRWTGSEGALAAKWTRTVSGGGASARARRAAVTSLTHPRMFRYFRAATDDFLFVQMLDVAGLMLAARPAIRELMRSWIQCALTLDCIMPIGAQSDGCRFDKKPQYRYSGCHGSDASALSIILPLRFGFEETKYTHGALWRRDTDAAARAHYTALVRNVTEADHTSETSDHA